MMEVTQDIIIEDLVDLVPGSIEYLMKEGIRCVRCGEPIWGTLAEAAEEKGFSQKDIDRFVRQLQKLAK